MSVKLPSELNFFVEIVNLIYTAFNKLKLNDSDKVNALFPIYVLYEVAL